ncbi:phosphomethylpyrimidine synthase ThiC [Candidatus Omnitrophota bacterium]
MQNSLKAIARSENIDLKILKKNIEEGRAVVVRNRKRKIAPLAIGQGLRIKINANIGASTQDPRPGAEIRKVSAAQEAGADSLMDLSVGGDLKKIRKRIIEASTKVVGTVPIYEAAVKAEKKYGSFERMTGDDIIETIEEQAAEGVDFFTIHSGITKDIIEKTKVKKRKAGIVSRGGAILARWILANKKENPLYARFEEIIEIANKYNVALSLGDGLRPGAIADSLDFFQTTELKNLGHLTGIGRKKGAAIIIEGPGHVPIDEIEANVRLQKEICKGAPFYVLGPLVTDIALGFDHISSAIGGALACMHGADFLCVVTPKEHLGHPNEEDIRQGVIAARIAAHSVDLIRNKKLRKQDDDISDFRRKRNWKKHVALSIYPKQAQEVVKDLKTSDVCSMCGKYCSLQIMEECSLF